MALDFSDTLSFSLLEHDNDCGSHCQITMKGNVPQEKNLVFKAVSLFREYTGFSKSLSINVEKNIPFGAGLGGGSSDAASTLLALNALGDCKLSHEELNRLALRLGSDVPFFLKAGTGAATAFVSGRGEHIEPVKTPEGLWIVLVNPRFSVNTAEAFRLCDEFRFRDEFRFLDEHRFRDSHVMLTKQALIDALSAHPVSWQYQNDFLPIFLSPSYAKDDEKKAYRDIFDTFKESGASFSGLSGSGSTCFGVFLDKEKAEKAVNSFYSAQYFIKLTFPLAV
jgi:4-diphosphocytidyl-2-C-methyl-D-erythritol kinase